MSKSAIKSLNRANEILAVLGLSVNVDMINDSDIRKDWRNADVLACLIINSAANALQSENADTFEENMFDDMQDAINCYTQANLESWNQKEWTARDVKAELARLAEMVNGQLAYNAREKDHAEALKVNDIVDGAVMVARCYSHNDNLSHIGIQRAVDCARQELLALERYPARFIVKMMVSVRRLAGEAREKARKEYIEMLSRPASSVAGCEIPF